MSKRVFDLLINVLVVWFVVAIPAGIAMMLYTDNAVWLLLTAIGLIVLYAG